jgi:hypothetical protein
MSNFTQLLLFFYKGAMFIACKADVLQPSTRAFIVGILILEKNTTT